MVKTAVSGAVGRMGGCIVNLIQESSELDLYSAIESQSCPRLGEDIGEIIGIGKSGVIVTSGVDAALDGAEVLIDFSHAESALGILRVATDQGIPCVVGTTGFSLEETEEIQSLAEKIPCVFAPNMSVGVNLLFKVLGDVAAVLGDDYDVEIVEAHHRMKKDAPSGTALKMAQVLAEALNRNLEEVGVYGRKGLIGERSKKEIGVQTLRGGDIVGEHTVMFCGLGERIEITHRASSRDTFARGALKAAAWVVGRDPGLYTMQNVLGIV